jgi:two-component system, NarL family, response regulator DevR
MVVRIGIVDNDPYALAVMKTVIERLDADFAVVWTTDIGAVAISRCLNVAKCPDVLVTDMAMTGADGAEVSRAIRMRASHVGIVGVTSYAVSSFYEAAASCGMQSLVAKTDMPNLGNAIRAAAQGKAYQISLAEDDVESVGKEFPHFMDVPEVNDCIEEQQYSKRGKLSNRERETLHLYAEGLSTKEIAAHMNVSVATVATFERRAVMKLGARSRTHAIAICIRRHEF